MSVKKVAYVTGSRADYGIVRRYLEKMNNDAEIELEILVTGALLSYEYGHQVDLIKEDGFKISAEIELTLDASSNAGVLHSMSEALDCFGYLFEKNKYDLLIILGDRYEVFAVAIAAAMQKVPILHLHGGEATYGNYDEFIRHAITKMSLYHFTATEEYRRRVIQLGENPKNVFNLGALGAENCLIIDNSNVSDEIKSLEEKKYFVVLFHPETLTDKNPLEQVNNLLKAIAQFDAYKFVFIGANADTNSSIIRSRVKEYVCENSNTVYYENLHSDSYHYLLKRSICLVGNSSSGIIEAPSLGVYTINIGERQKGRVRGNSVIDVECDVSRIIDAMEYVISNCTKSNFNNPYFQEDTSWRYYKKTKDLLNREIDDVKCFYDM